MTSNWMSDTYIKNKMQPVILNDYVIMNTAVVTKTTVIFCEALDDIWIKINVEGSKLSCTGQKVDSW